MDYKLFLNRLRFVIFNPVKAWDIIETEKRPVKDERNSFLFPVLVIVAVFAFAGSLLFSNSGLSPVYSLFVSIRYFITDLAVVYASAVVLVEITKALDLGRNFGVSLRLIVYSFTPLFLCQMASSLFESLIFVNVLSLYGIYIFWTGAVKMLNPPEHKRRPMLVAILVVSVELYVALTILLSSLTDRIYFAFFA